MEIERGYLNTIKAIYDQPIADTFSEKLKAFPQRTRQGCLLLPHLFNIVLEILAIAIREKRNRKGIQDEKEVKLILC